MAIEGRRAVVMNSEWSMEDRQSLTKEGVMRYVKGFCAVLFAAGLIFSAGSLFAEVDDGSHIKITSPKDGATVGETFELTYELTKGSKAAHGHVYLDGEPQKKFPGTFKGLSKGKHEIKVQAATHDHDHLAATDAITVEVQ
ncbi:MAG: hypothetical protein H8K05_04670 [Nitrospira sp.]|nr:hypothetical protein [Nitrospira sp.]